MLFAVLIASATLSQLATEVHSQRPPVNRPIGHPPPPDHRGPPRVQNEDAVQALIDDLIKSNAAREQQVDNMAPMTDSERRMGPMALVNSSAYWHTTNLQPDASIRDRRLAEQWLAGYLPEARKLLHMATLGGWNYFTNLTDYNRNRLVEGEEVSKVTRLKCPMALVNSSAYWHTTNLQPDASIRDRRLAEQWLAGYLPEARKLLHMATLGGWNYFTNLTDYNRNRLVEGEEVSKVTRLKCPMALVNSSAYWHTTNLQPDASIRDRHLAEQWLAGYPPEARKLLHMATLGRWNTFTNLTDYNRNRLVEGEEVLGSFLKSTAMQAKQFDLASFENATLRRMLHLLSIEGMTALPDSDFKQFNALNSQMAILFTNGAVCEQNRAPPCTLLYADVQALMATSRDAGQLLHAWIAWRTAVGGDLRAPFWRHVALSNAGANLNGFEDAGALYRSPYEMTAPTLGRGAEVDLVEELTRVYEQIKPLYKQLHAYIRRMLHRSFKNVNALTSDGPIPAHLLGSLHGDSWTALYFDSVPFPRHGADDLSADPFTNSDPIGNQLYQLNYTEVKMFQQAETFYKSMGLPEMPASFWTKSLFTRPWDKDVLCHPPTAFDFKTKSDYREAANPSFSAAIAEALALASQNSDYMKSLGIDTAEVDGEEKRINRLFKDALDQVVGLPFSLVVDLWRWKAYAGQIAADNATSAWWMLRHEYQGIGSPVSRNDAADFDAATTPVIAQQHFPAVRRFIAYVMQFQILRALCHDAGMHGELQVSKCNLQGSTAAGHRLLTTMRLGSSVDWPQVLAAATGGDGRLDATAMLEHYRPLYEWLKTENARTGEHLGWDGPGTPFKDLGTEGDSRAPYAGDGSDASDNGLQLNNPDGEPLAKVAFPGDSCVQGERCIQESRCNGTQCVCAPGLVRFEEHCLPGDPGFVGFGDNRPLINIHRSEPVAPEPAPESEADTKSHTVGSRANPTVYPACSLCTVLWVLVVAVADVLLL